MTMRSASSETSSKTTPILCRVPAAQFYIGEALFIQKKFDQALEQFDIVLEKYPNSDRKCLALYRKGRAHVELKQNPQATAAMQAVVKDCAGTQEAVNATADLKSLSTTTTGAIGLETRYGKVD